MLRIYLDQKDYIRIAQGLHGRQGYEEDVKTFEYLMKQKQAGNIKVYYSVYHLEEAAKYTNNNPIELDDYIHSVKSLTDGECIISHIDLTKREIEIFLSDSHKFKTKYGFDNYLYGKKSEAIIAELDFDINTFFLGKRLQKGDRIKYLNILNGMTREELSKRFPGSEKMNKNDFIKMIIGNCEERLRIRLLKQYLDVIFEFEAFLKYYRNSIPQMNSFALKLVHDQSEKLLEIIVDAQVFQSKDGELALTEDEIINRTCDVYLGPNGFVHDVLKNLYSRNKFPIDTVIDEFKRTNLNQILSISSYMRIIIEYLKRHKGELEISRKPDPNDYQDINHMRYLPYVDLYVCERFFSEVSKNIAKKYNTTIFRNLKDLRFHLENSFM